jgi:hypothetical protein
MRAFFTSLLGFACWSFVQAQTVILTAADFAQPGDFAEFKVNATPTGLTADTLAGFPGVVDVLDLTGQSVTDSYTLNFVNPASLSAGVYFPGATVGYTSPTGVQFFMENTASALKILGTAGSLQGTQLVAQFNPGYTILNYPCTEGTTINSPYEFESILAVGFDSLYNLLGTPVQVTIDSAHVKRKAVVNASFNEVVLVRTPENPAGTLALKAFVIQDNTDTLWLKLGNPISIPAFGINYPADWILVDNNLYTLLVTALGYDPGVKTGRTLQKSVEYFAKFRRFRFAGVELNTDGSVKRVEWISSVNNIGIPNPKNYEVTIFPNPTQEILWVEAPELGLFQATVRDGSGRILVSQQLYKQGALFLDNLAAGTYLLELRPLNLQSGIVSKLFVKP